MKKFIFIIMVLILSFSMALAEEKEKAVDITLTIGDTVIPAKLNHTVASNDLLSRLPYTVTVSRGSVDFCGDIGEPLHYSESDFQYGWQYGDFMWMPNGNWFVIFIDGIETYAKKNWLVLGHMGPEWEAIKNMQGTIQIKIARADDR